jgi:2-polyprenyl-3-methyl-5-hydroxy-6-metoxy-1,4-benzoquinol methylase
MLSFRAIYKFRNIFKLYDSESKLTSDNQKYWNRDYSDPNLAQDAHWKNKGKFEDQLRWFSLGKEHLDLILNYSYVLNFNLPVKQIVEWGCGGGANAIHFAPLTEKFIGIDITLESLNECKKQILNCGLKNFQPVLIDASKPESILNEQICEVDLFLCTYVYELLPSPAYGLTVLKIANKILKDEGIAFIQIRYNDGRKDLKPKHWGYKLQPYIMTSYSLEEFWKISIEYGFEPLCIYLKPYQPLVNDSCYAYFFLKKIVKSKKLL